MAGDYYSHSESLAAAEKQVAAIKDYWRSKGVLVTVWIEPQHIRVHNKSSTHYVIKSSGIPRGKV